jgi:Protein kinase domain
MQEAIGAEDGDGAAAANSASVEAVVGECRIPGYALDAIVGRGGGGVVYRAYVEATGQVVAIKIIARPLAGDAATKRAWRELQLLSELRLPCLPQVRDFGETQGRLYIVTDFVDGQPLDEFCEEGGLPLRARVELLVKVTTAVQALHEHRVIHRDIKPANILIDTHGNVAIVDLGIAALFGENAAQTITAEGVPIGSPAFMSPEQARGERAAVTTRSDVYSLGATAYLLLTGDTPHDTRTSIHTAIRRVAEETPRRPRDLNEGLPKPLAAVLHKCVSPKADCRYPSAQAFGEDLQRWLDGESVQATPPNVAQRFGRFVGRHPVVTTAGACAAIVLLTATLSYAGVWWMSVRPHELVISPDRTRARLLPAMGPSLRSYDIGREEAPHLAEMLRPPGRFIGAGRFVLGTVRSSGYEELGKLLFYSTADPERPLREVLLEVPERLASEGGVYRVMRFRFGFAEDVFKNKPGIEVVAVHWMERKGVSHIGVYDDLGRVLYGAWHPGQIRAIRYVPESNQIVCCGLRSEEADELGAGGAGPAAHYPIFVYGLRPEVGRKDLYMGEVDTLAPADVAWCLRLGPPGAEARLTANHRSLGPGPGGLSGAGVVSIEFFVRDSEGAAVKWVVDAAGRIVDGPETNNEFESLSEQVGLPYSLQAIRLPTTPGDE